MIFIILAGNWVFKYTCIIFGFLSFSLIRTHASFLSLSRSFLVDRIVYQHVLYCIVWLRCIFAPHFRVCRFRRIAPALFFLRFASASLYNSLTLIVNSSQARRASSVAYLYYQVDHSIYNAFFFVFVFFVFSVCL